MASKATTTSKPAGKASKATSTPQGRTVANPANPTAQGWQATFAQAATAAGWAVTTAPVASTPQAVALYGGNRGCIAIPEAQVATHPNGNIVVATAFTTTPTGQARLDAAYLYVPGATSGQRLQSCKLVLATLGNGGNRDQAREATSIAPRDQATTQPATTTSQPTATAAKGQQRQTQPTATGKRGKATQAA